MNRFLPFAAATLLVLCVALAAWHPVPAGVWHDDGAYVLIGRAIAGGHGFTYQGVVGAPPAVKFPPVYPVLLGGLWRLGGSLGTVTLAATVLNLVLVAAAAGCLGWALARSGLLPPLPAAAAGAAAFVSGDVLRTTSVALSEPLFLALAALAFALWRPARVDAPERPASPAPVLALAAILALLVSTRAAGVAFLAAFALAYLFERRPRAGLVVVGPAVLAWIAWTAWASSANQAVPPELRDLLGSYGGWLGGQALSNPGAFLARLPGHAAGVLDRVAALLLPRLYGWPLRAAFVPLAGLVVVGWRCALRRHPPIAWSALLYLGLLLAWPYLDRRLVVPLHVLAFVLACVGAWSLAAPAAPDRARSRGRTIAAAFSVVWLAGYLVLSTLRIAEGWPASAYRIRAERLAAAVEALERVAPPDSVVGAPEFWAALHLHGGWTVVPSTLFAPGIADDEAPSWGTPEEQLRLWRDAGVDFLLLEQGGLLHAAALDLLESRCPGSTRLEAALPPQLIAALDWEAC